MVHAVTKQKRIVEIDIVKGIGIMLIAVYHIVYRSMDGIPDKMIRSLGWALIGIFFLLSGYTCRPNVRLRDIYRSRVLGLMLPVILTEIFLLFFGGLYCILMHDYTVRDVLHDAVVTFLRPEISNQISGTWGDGGILFFNLSPVWFIWSMGWTELFFHPLRSLTIGRGKGQMPWIALVLFLFAIQIPMYVYLRPAPWGLTIIPVYLIFMLIGAMFRNRRILERLMNVPPLPAFFITIVCFAAHFGLFLFNGNEGYYLSKFGNRGALDVFTVILQVLIALPAFFFFARAVGKVKLLAGGISWIGRHTLGILLMHCILGVVYCDLFKNYIKPGPYWYLETKGIPLTAEIVLKSILCWALAVASCIPILYIWDKVQEKLFGKLLRERKQETGKMTGEEQTSKSTS